MSSNFVPLYRSDLHDIAYLTCLSSLGSGDWKSSQPLRIPIFDFANDDHDLRLYRGYLRCTLRCCSMPEVSNFKVGVDIVARGELVDQRVKSGDADIILSI